MAQPYVGEIRMFAGNFAPAGWMFCDGQLLPISENETLFQLIGTTYGGDGESTFALPDLRGRIPIHQGNGFVLARDRRRRGGHPDASTRSRRTATRAGLDGDRPTRSAPAGERAARSRRRRSLRRGHRDRAARRRSRSARPAAASRTTNFQPYLCINFIISLFGIFPSPT